MTDTRQPVPVRTMLVAIALVVATYLTLRAIVLLAHILTLLVVAAFFAIVLTPAVDLFRRKLHVSRGLSTAIVFVAGIAIFSGLLYAFISPLVDEGREFADNFPTYVSEAREGRGPAGDRAVVGVAVAEAEGTEGEGLDRHRDRLSTPGWNRGRRTGGACRPA